MTTHNSILRRRLMLSGSTVLALGLAMPLAATAHQMFMQASTAGFGREDDSAVIKIFPGITLPERQA